MSDKTDFAFGKRVGVNDEVFSGNAYEMTKIFNLLLHCLKETNEKHGVGSEFFRLDFRPMSLDEQLTGEFPRESLILDMKWGSKKEVEEK